MNWISVILLAIVEGLTEFLPVSSTGHMIMASALLRLSQSDFLRSFEIVVQLGAIAAVLSKYWQLLLKRKDYWLKIAMAFIPTSVVGVMGYKLFKEVFLGSVEVTMMGLLVGGVAIILVDRLPKSKSSIESLTYKQAAIIGALQALAIVPGVSRSAATILAGQRVGLSPAAAVEFSFLLALPVLAAASGYDLLKTGFAFTVEEWMQLGAGMMMAFGVARLTIDWLMGFVQRHRLAVFGWYRIIVALIYLTSRWVFGH